MSSPLHVTNGDAVVPEIAAAAGVDPAGVLAWRDVLHDGPVPGGLDPPELARVRAAHLAGRGWADEQEALAELLRRDSRLARHPDSSEIVLWFETDLYDTLQLAQIADRVHARSGRVSLVSLPHPPRGNLRAALDARQQFTPDPAPFAALRSTEPTTWPAIPGFGRLVEELPDRRSGLSRTERQILEALSGSPLSATCLFSEVAQRERRPWLGDWPLWAIADELAPLVAGRRNGERAYELTEAGRAVLDGLERRPVPDRWIGGVHLGPGRRGWGWDQRRKRVVPA